MDTSRKAHVDYVTMYEIFVFNDKDDVMDWVSTKMRYSDITTALIRAMQIYPELETKVEPVYDHPVFRFN